MLLAVFYLVLLAALLVLLVNLKRPTNHRPWRADLERPPKIAFDGDRVSVQDVRNIRYGAPGTPYTGRWEDRTYDLSKLKRVWFVVESFSQIEAIAHTLVSFEFEGGEYLAFSAEARVLEDEPYNIVRGLFNNFELIYTFGDERDFILRRAVYQDHDVYLYPLTMPPNELKKMLRDIFHEANILRTQPRFYNSVSRNCTNLLGLHADHARPGSFAWWRPEQVLPGTSDRLLYRRGWIDTTLPFEKLREVYNVRHMAQKYQDDPDVSTKMREGFERYTKGSEAAPD